MAREPLTGKELRRIFEEILLLNEILAFAYELGVVQRQRKLDVAALVNYLDLDLPGPLRTVNDWGVVDSETVKLSSVLQKVYPGTGDCAAVKVHKALSLSTGAAILETVLGGYRTRWHRANEQARQVRPPA